jgi:hypothetical protein
MAVNITSNHITASGDISASVNVYAADYFDNGTNISTIYAPKADPTFTGTGSFDWIEATGGITASNLFLDANTLYIGGTPFSKADVDNLKLGKSIASDSDKKFVNTADSTTYIRMGTSAKAWHYVNGVPVMKLGIGTVAIGDDSTNLTIGSAGIGGVSIGGGNTATLNITGSGGMTIEGPTTLGTQGITGGMVVTGSTVISGSTTITGGFGVGNLLDLLANYGAVGIPTGSGEGGVSAGDINLDGQVNVTDLLLLLSGFGNPNCIATNLTIPQNTNYQLVGPEICVNTDIIVTVGTNSYLTIT